MGSITRRAQRSSHQSVGVAGAAQDAKAQHGFRGALTHFICSQRAAAGVQRFGVATVMRPVTFLSLAGAAKSAHRFYASSFFVPAEDRVPNFVDRPRYELMKVIKPATCRPSRTTCAQPGTSTQTQRSINAR